jgi:DNA-binding NtrC family response regulator/tetratricopeptide (TPR) repeat protein
MPSSDPLDEIVGDSPSIRALRDQVRTLLGHQSAARRLPTVLILGETGVGKGLLARALHRASARTAGPFVAVNCAAIPDTLVESELSGYERGAFTDARQPKDGLFQSADGGTLFLDEIGVLPLAVQAKLLTALEDRRVRRIGSTRTEAVDLWIIAATSEDLRLALRERHFREDLYYRLATVTFTVPPLRERDGDVVTLAEHFLRLACAEYELPPRTFSAAARDALRNHRWPGNVRELANVVERAVLLTAGTSIGVEQLGVHAPGELVVAAAPAREEPTVRDTLHDFERSQLLAALESTDWNLSRSAVRLGIPRNTLRYRMQKLALQRHGGASRESSAPTARAPRHRPSPPLNDLRGETRALAFLHVNVEPANALPTSALGETLRSVMEKIGAFGGRIEDIRTNDVVAIFGLEPQEDATARAAHVAAAARAAARNAARHSHAPIVRAAIHVSRAFVGTIGGDTFADPSDKVLAAATLRELVARAPAGTAVVSAAAVPFLARRFVLGAVPGDDTGDGSRIIVGLEATGLGIGGRPLTCFVGREHEMEALRAELSRAAAGRGGVVHLTGEPGSGKSRLLYEFRQEITARADGTPSYVEGCCTSYATVRPYGPIGDVIRRLSGADDADDTEVAAAKLRALAAAIPGLTPTHTARLLDLLEPAAAPTPDSPNPEAVRAQTFAAVTRLCAGIAAGRTLVLAIEDLHWCDPTSLALLAELGAMAGSAPMLIVSTARPGADVPWTGAVPVTEVALSPLSTTASLQVVRAVLGAGGAHGDVEQLILDRAAGNPFLLEEHAFAAREHGGVGIGDRVPPTVEGLLRTRIDRLGADERHLVHVAAALGDAVSPALVGRIARQPADAVTGRLERLVAAGLLRESRAGGDAAYTFTHALTRDVAYESVPPAARRAIHETILDVLKRTGAGRGEEAERLAFHAMRAEAWEQAIDYFRQAAAQAFARSSNREALACLERALEALDRLPETPAGLELGVELRFDLRAALFLLGRIDDVAVHLREAARLAQRLQDPLRLGRAWTYLTHHQWITGASREARTYAQRALGVADGSGDELLELTTRLYGGLAHHSWGDYDESERLLRSAVTSLAGARSRERLGQVGYPGVLARGYLVYCLADRGGFDEGVALGREGIEIAEAVGHPYSLGIVCWDLAYLYCVKGDTRAAIALAQRCANVHDLDRRDRAHDDVDLLENVRRWAPVLSAPRVLWLFGHIYTLGGRATDGIALLEEARAHFARVGMRVYEALVDVHLGEAYAFVGRLADARAAAERALGLAAARDQRGHRAYALRLLAEVTASAELYSTAAEEARTLGMRPLEARCRLGLALLGHRAGTRDSAVQLGHAAALFRDLGMRAAADALPP